MKKLVLLFVLPFFLVLGIALYVWYPRESVIDSSLPFYNHTPDKRAIELNNKAFEFSGETGGKLFYMEKPQEALALLDEAIKMDPLYKLAYANKGTIHIYQKDYPNALEAFRKTIKIDPRDPTKYAGAAAVLKIMGRKNESHEYFAKSIQAYDLKLREKPKDKFILMNKYYIYAAMGEKAKAIKGVESYLKDNPNDEFARALLDEIKSKKEINIIDPHQESFHNTIIGD